MEKEIKNNSELLGKYLKHPRVTNEQISDLRKMQDKF